MVSQSPDFYSNILYRELPFSECKIQPEHIISEVFHLHCLLVHLRVQLKCWLLPVKAKQLETWIPYGSTSPACTTSCALSNIWGLANIHSVQGLFNSGTNANKHPFPYLISMLNPFISQAKTCPFRKPFRISSFCCPVIFSSVVCPYYADLSWFWVSIEVSLLPVSVPLRCTFGFYCVQVYWSCCVTAF